MFYNPIYICLPAAITKSHTLGGWTTETYFSASGSRDVQDLAPGEAALSALQTATFLKDGGKESSLVSLVREMTSSEIPPHLI